jgi:hypothetical protein
MGLMNRIVHKILVTFVLCAVAVYSEAGIAPSKSNASGALKLETATPLQLVWQRLDVPDPPPPRIGFSLALDSTNKRALLFGGYNIITGDLNDLWSTNGNEWTQLQFSHKPIERVGASMIYDEARQETILFGGKNNSEYFGSTWKYDLYGWFQQFPQTSPTTRANACMAYDAARKKT